MAVPDSIGFDFLPLADARHQVFHGHPLLKRHDNIRGYGNPHILGFIGLRGMPGLLGKYNDPILLGIQCRGFDVENFLGP